MVFRRWLTVIVFCILSGGFSITASPAKGGENILIGGGAASGDYYQIALHTCAIVNKYSGGKYNCIGRPGLGSVLNIHAVDRGLLDLGVCQSDRNAEAWNGEGSWKKGKTGIRSVFSMQPEFLCLVTRKDTGIRSVTALKGKTVNIGNTGSGHRGMALDVLRLYGIDPQADIRAEGMPQGEASRALIDRRIDAFFYSVGLGSPAIQQPADSIDADLIHINSPEIRQFVASKPYYVMAVIPSGSYKGVNHDTETYGMKATLVCEAGASDQMIYDYVRMIFEHLDELKQSVALFATLDPVSMLGGLTAPLHPGAVKYYKERGWM